MNKSTINRIQLGERYKSAGGSVRQSKFKRVSAEVKTQTPNINGACAVVVVKP